MLCLMSSLSTTTCNDPVGPGYVFHMVGEIAVGSFCHILVINRRWARFQGKGQRIIDYFISVRHLLSAARSFGCMSSNKT